MTRITPFRLKTRSALSKSRSDWDRWLEDFWSGSGGLIDWNADTQSVFNPKLSIKETDKAYEVTAELPGMKEEDVELGFSDNSLTIKGEKKLENKEEKENFTYNERVYGSFYRSIPFAADIDESKIDAEFKNGILKVSLAKAEEPTNQAKRIKIRS